MPQAADSGTKEPMTIDSVVAFKKTEMSAAPKRILVYDGSWPSAVLHRFSLNDFSTPCGGRSMVKRSMTPAGT